MITRRTLLGVSSLLLAPTVLRRAAAAPLSRSLPWAVSFDGNTYCTNPGTIGGFTNSNRYAFVSFNYKSGGAGDFLILACPGAATSGDWNNLLSITLGTDTKTEQIRFTLGPTSTSDGTGFVGVLPNLLVGSQWHNVLMAFDAGGGLNFATGAQTVVKAYVDGSSVAANGNYCGGRAINNVAVCDPWVFNWAGLPWYVGGTPEGQITSGGVGVPFQGYLADVFVVQGQNLFDQGGKGDIDDPYFRAVFYDSNNEVASRQSSNGATPGMTMPSNIAPWSPQIFLSGNKDLFPTNFAQAGGGFTWPDNFVPASGSFNVVGNLATAADDPFGPGF